MRRRLWSHLRSLAGGAAPAASVPPFGPPPPGPLRDRVLGTEPVLRRVLTENILPFWQARAVDAEHGGYLLHHDATGRWKGPAPKHVVVQARTLWFFSRLARAGLAPDARQMADTGFDFLRARMWDAAGGGFVWAVDHTGLRTVDPVRRVYGQAFGLYAVSEYALASGRPGAASFAREIFELLEARYHDARHGGYASALGDPGAGWSEKSCNDHLHLLEALAPYSALDPGPAVRTRLWELLVILTRTVMRSGSRASAEAFRQDWSPVLPPGRAPVSYGHDIEGAWLVLAAADALGAPPDLFRVHALDVLETLLEQGLDRSRGGVWHAGLPGRRATDRRKVWWVQAEALVGCLDVYCRFGVAAAGSAYLSILDWIVSAQADWEHGEWHDTVSAKGEASGDKAGPWKGPYHSGRAMLECLDRLGALGGTQPGAA